MSNFKDPAPTELPQLKAWYSRRGQALMCIGAEIDKATQWRGHVKAAEIREMLPMLKELVTSLETELALPEER